MTVAAVYAYPVLHYDHHRRQAHARPVAAGVARRANRPAVVTAEDEQSKKRAGSSKHACAHSGGSG